MGDLTIRPKSVANVLTDGAASLADPSTVESFVGAIEVCNEIASALNGATGENLTTVSKAEGSALYSKRSLVCLSVIASTESRKLKKVVSLWRDYMYCLQKRRGLFAIYFELYFQFIISGYEVEQYRAIHDSV